MYMKIISIINEEYNLIQEKVYDITDDVDLLYDKFFKKDIELINKNDIRSFRDKLFRKDRESSRIFKSKTCVEAHEKNPIQIFINNHKHYYNNVYDFKNKKMYIGINDGAFEIIKNFKNIQYAIDFGYENIDNEFTEEKIKGSIRHEMIHWLDDTFTDAFKSDYIIDSDKFRKYKKKNYIYLNKFEINAMIGNIIELKRKYKDEWDYISFEEMLNQSPSLRSIRRHINNKIPEKYAGWKKNILKRMDRENLLGAKMKY